MSASAGKRLSRLLGRIAEQRVARGRPPDRQIPKRATKLFTLRMGELQPPEMSGTEANMLQAELTQGFPQEPPKPRNFSVYKPVDGDGNYVTEQVSVLDPVERHIWCQTGVDYMGLGSEEPTGWGPKVDRKPKQTKVANPDLIDILFK